MAPVPSFGDELDEMERGLLPKRLREVRATPRWLEERHGSHELERSRQEQLEAIRGKSSDDVQRCKNAMLEEAKAVFFKSDFERALRLYVDALMLSEADASDGSESVTGAVLHNIASCLHHLDEMNEAQEWYARAIATFHAIKPAGRVSRFLGEDTSNERRIQFTVERLQMAAQGRLPPSEFLDTEGKKQKASGFDDHGQEGPRACDVGSAEWECSGW